MFKMRKLNRKLSPYTTEIYKVILQKNNLSNNLTNSKSKKYCKDKLVNNPKKTYKQPNKFSSFFSSPN